MKENFLIVAGGSLFSPDDVLRKISCYDTVIAVDSGFDRCMQLGLKPDVLIGDCDSIVCEEINCSVIKFNPIKDQVDLKLAVDFAFEQGCKKLTLLCCTGGRVDHLLNNFAILDYAFCLGIECEIIDEFNVVKVINSHGAFKNISKYISIIPVTDRVLCSVSNMKYPMENMTILRENIVSISNECITDEFEIDIKSGRAFVVFAD